MVEISTELQDKPISLVGDSGKTHKSLPNSKLSILADIITGRHSDEVVEELVLHLLCT